MKYCLIKNILRKGWHLKLTLCCRKSRHSLNTINNYIPILFLLIFNSVIATVNLYMYIYMTFYKDMERVSAILTFIAIFLHKLSLFIETYGQWIFFTNDNFSHDHFFISLYNCNSIFFVVLCFFFFLISSLHTYIHTF